MGSSSQDSELFYSSEEEEEGDEMVELECNTVSNTPHILDNIQDLLCPQAPGLSYLSHEQCLSIWQKKLNEEMSKGQEGEEVNREDEDGGRRRNILHAEEAGRRSTDEEKDGGNREQEEACKTQVEGNLLLSAVLSKAENKEESRKEKEVEEDQEDPMHVHSIIESIETLLIMDDDKAFNNADTDLKGEPKHLPGPGKDQEQQEASLPVQKEIRLELTPGKTKLEEASFVTKYEEDAVSKGQAEEKETLADGGKVAVEMKDKETSSVSGQSESGEEETLLVLAPSWKGEASCKRCNVFPALINSGVWRSEGPR